MTRLEFFQTILAAIFGAKYWPVVKGWLAPGRALKASYTVELAEDLRAYHGLDAETELANILSKEIMTEINREIIRTIYNINGRTPLHVSA